MNRAILTGLIVILSSCQGSIRPIVRDEDTWCGEGRPAQAVAFDSTLLDSLVGRFDLVLVAKQPEGHQRLTQGRLELWRQDSTRVWLDASRQPLPDSVRRRQPLLARYLGGSFEVQPPDTSYWWRRMASRSLNHPGVQWYFGMLKMGDVDITDGTGEDLTVNWVAPGSFGGHWHREMGIAVVVNVKTHQIVPNPGGYFCARRVGA